MRKRRSDRHSETEDGPRTDRPPAERSLKGHPPPHQHWDLRFSCRQRGHRLLWCAQLPHSPEVTHRVPGHSHPTHLCSDEIHFPHRAQVSTSSLFHAQLSCSSPVLAPLRSALPLNAPKSIEWGPSGSLRPPSLGLMPSHCQDGSKVTI